MNDFLAIYPDWVESFYSLQLKLLSGFTGDTPPPTQSRKGELRGNVAIIHIDAPIINADVWAEDWGFSTIKGIQELLDHAVSNSQVAQIVLHFDSPGGTVTGTHELAGYIHQTSARKPISSYVSGLCCSAAYWLAAASSRIVIAETAIVGSIGVVQTFVKYTGDAKEITIVSTHAPKKRVDPETPDGEKEILKTLDALEAIFIGDVASFRNVSRAEVIDNFGQGGVFVGKHALQMVDAVQNSQGFFSDLQGNKIMLTAEQVNQLIQTATHPELEGLRQGFTRIEAKLAELTERVAQKDTVINQMAEQQKAEASRKEDIENLFALFAHEPLHAEKYATLRADCLANPQCTATEAHRQLIGLRATLSATPQVPTTTANTTFAAEPAKAKGFLELVAELEAKQPSLKHSEAMEMIAEQYPQAHQAYVKSTNEART